MCAILIPFEENGRSKIKKQDLIPSLFVERTCISTCNFIENEIKSSPI